MKKIIVVGAGPIRIGQGIEFDYSTVHAIRELKKQGYHTIVVNNNPETVSTDYSICDKLYFEPIKLENILEIINIEKPIGVIVSFGGQTAINLAEQLTQYNIKLIGTNIDAIKKTENRKMFLDIVSKNHINIPKAKAVYSIKKGIKAANNIGFPVIVRPSFVLGGRAMQVIRKKNQLKQILKDAFKIDKKQPVLIDKFITGTEIEIDAICDGKNIYCPGVMQHIDPSGIHSGDSTCIFPAYSLNKKVKKTINKYISKLALSIEIIGLFNVQFVVDSNNNVFVLEVNARSSRTIPFLSKACGIDLTSVATKVMLGQSLENLGLVACKDKNCSQYFVKTPVFSMDKLPGANTALGPEMKSTGEVMTHNKDFKKAIKLSKKASRNIY